MTKLTAVFKDKGQAVRQEIEKWFVASTSPKYIGVITKPAPGLWEYMSHSKELIVEIEEVSYSFRIPYRIEVGESSIFFLTPTAGEIPELGHA